MKIYKLLLFSLVISTFFLANNIIADFKSLVETPEKIADIVEKILNSKQELENFQIELKKIPLFIKGCTQAKLKDPSSYPHVKVVNPNIELKDSRGNIIYSTDPQSGQKTSQKLSVPCDSFKEALSPVSKILEFLETKLLGTKELTAKGSGDKAIFVDFFELIKQENAIPELYRLSDLIENFRYFIDRVDKVLKIKRETKAETQS